MVNSGGSMLLIWVSSILCVICVSLGYNPVDNYLIDCGSSTNKSVGDRLFVADQFYSNLLSIPHITFANASSSPNSSAYDPSLFQTARIFNETSFYTFSVNKSGRHWIRLYFFPFVFRSYNLSTAKFCVSAQNFTLIKEYQPKVNPEVKEFSFNVTSDRLVLTFTPFANSIAFINALEVFSLPDELIPPGATTIGPQGKYQNLGKQALETVESNVESFWQMSSCQFHKRTANREYCSILCLCTATILNSDPDPQTNANVTWLFDVDPGFEYLVRFHFCDILPRPSARRRSLADLSHRKAEDHFPMNEGDTVYTAGSKFSNGTLIFSTSKFSYRFPFVAIQEATDNFSESLVLGVGGFGKNAVSIDLQWETSCGIWSLHFNSRGMRRSNHNGKMTEKFNRANSLETGGSAAQVSIGSMGDLAGVSMSKVFAQMVREEMSNVHNHELLEDDQVQLLPAYRKIHEADQERILLLSKARSPVHRIVKVLELEKGIQGGQLPFLERDVRNFVQNRKKIVQDNDAVLTGKEKMIPWNFLRHARLQKRWMKILFMIVQSMRMIRLRTLRGHLVTLFVHMVMVYFDTSYVRSHMAFIRLMKGKCPQTILTDLHMGLKDAISSESPAVNSALQHELVSVMQYASSEMTGGSYLIHHFKKMDGEHFVIWMPEDGQIHCSCKEFESSGILCRHALRERSDFVHGELPKELTRLLGEVRAMPDGDGVAMDLAPSPAG
ncbi:hypothetical protein GH714_009535 [Hevea brasiliensis]|uniref:SWIM-type domain-containing protein n=1 Tax=Hevea brasiliensis TaxID=3981 RepID=A0A6A6N246_HEVBR|nr:hypothetical protein GH714_009535 [Hevea brasiliensis]